MTASSLPEDQFHQLQEASRFQSPCLRDLARWVHEKPDAPALRGVGQPPVSFKLFAARIAFVAEVLRASGVRPGDIVAVAMPDGPEFLTALLGTMEAAAAAPLDWQLAEAELRSRLTLLSPRVLLRSAAADGHAAAVARTLGIPVVGVDATLKLRRKSSSFEDVAHLRNVLCFCKPPPPPANPSWCLSPK